MKKKNAIEYIFDIQKDSLYKKISLQLNLKNILILDAKAKSISLQVISNLFSQPNNESDFCLMPLGFVCKSKIYFKEDGDSVDYWAWFYLHLEEIDTGKTKVNIKTFEPEIQIGRDLLPTPPHFVRAINTMAVKPSTIEEYQILLLIGNLIGEKNMPAIILPDPKDLRQIIN